MADLKIMTEKQYNFMVKLENRLYPRNAQGEDLWNRDLINAINDKRDKITTLLASRIINYLKESIFYPPTTISESVSGQQTEDKLIAEIKAL